MIQKLCRTYTSISEFAKKIEEQEGIVILSIFIFKYIDCLDSLLLMQSLFLSRGMFLNF